MVSKKTAEVVAEQPVAVAEQPAEVVAVAGQPVKETVADQPAEPVAERPAVVAEEPVEDLSKYKGEATSVSSMVPAFIGLSNVYTAMPAAFTMSLEDTFGTPYVGKVIEVTPKSGDKPAEYVRIKSPEQVVALLASLPTLRDRFVGTLQAKLDAEFESAEYQTELELYAEMLADVEAKRKELQDRLYTAAKPFDLSKFTNHGFINVHEPRIVTSATVAGKKSANGETVRTKSPDSAKWNLDKYETDWNKEHLVLSRVDAKTWEVVSDSVGYVESNDDGSIVARGDSPNKAWRSFLLIRGRQPSVSTPRQFNAGEVEAQAAAGS